MLSERILTWVAIVPAVSLVAGVFALYVDHRIDRAQLESERQIALRTVTPSSIDHRFTLHNARIEQLEKDIRSLFARMVRNEETIARLTALNPESLNDLKDELRGK